MNKKLRLLVTMDCPNNCPMCCNNRFNIESIPVVDRWDYEEIMITGGEPLYRNSSDVIEVARSIRQIQMMMGVSSKIYLYTATKHASFLIDVIRASYYSLNLRKTRIFDGVVFTPHDRKAIRVLYSTTKVVADIDTDFSFRLNLFKDIEDQMDNLDEIEKIWNIKRIEWIEDCPVPEGEDFRRMNNLIRYNITPEVYNEHISVKC